MKKRISLLFEVISRLSKTSISSNDFDKVIDDILEKGLLLEVQTDTSLRLIEQSRILNPGILKENPSTAEEMV